MRTIYEFLLNEHLLKNKTAVKEYLYHPTKPKELRDIIIDLSKKGETNFNNIDTSAMTSMDSVFLALKYINEIDISEWDVSNVTDMSDMFNGCENFTADLSGWDVSSVNNMQAMFCECKKFDSDISNWDVSNVKDASLMFYDCESFSTDISGWPITMEMLKNTKYMFGLCYKLYELEMVPDWYENRTKILLNSKH